MPANKNLWTVDCRSDLIRFLEQYALVQESEERLAAALDNLFNAIENQQCPPEDAVAARVRAKDVIAARLVRSAIRPGRSGELT